MTTGRINQVTSPYRLNKQRVHSGWSKHTSRSSRKHPCLPLNIVHSVGGLN